LRAYVPAQTMAEINAIMARQNARADKLSRDWSAATAEILYIKERMKKDRLKIKELEKVRDRYFSADLFAEGDRAVNLAWAAARVAASGGHLRAAEAPKVETLAQVTERLKAEGVK